MTRSETMRIMWTEEAARERDALSDELRAEAYKAVDLIAADPEREGTHPIPGEESVRQMVTRSGLCITYTRVGSLTVVVVLQLFTTYAL